ncbi:MAG: class I SAM-dependent methyltransferase [Patescibacteria group bacterium]
MDTKHVYEETTFWQNRESWTVMGDWLGRIPALQMLNPQPGECILDAGYGEGLLTQELARAGAQVIAVDRSPVMLRKAKMRPPVGPGGIAYFQSDFTEYLPLTVRFDAVFCVAALMHDSQIDCFNFAHLVAQRLARGGRIVISITHPYQYLPNSPTRDGQSKWTQYEPVDQDASLEHSCRFIEHYVNIHGQVFDAEVWYHPESLFPSLLREVGLEVIHTQTTYVRPEHIAQSPLWAGSPWGHPAYYQLLAVKP